MKLLTILFACAACLIGSAAEAPTDATFADLAVPEKRLAAQQAILDHSRGFTNASPEAKAWFERVRTAAKTLENPEGQAALQQVLLFDPNLKPREWSRIACWAASRFSGTARSAKVASLGASAAEPMRQAA